MKKYYLGFFLSVYAVFAFAYTPKEGDVIFQVSNSSQSLAIQQATHSKYSHMGIVLFKSGQPYVFEASRTVRHTPLKSWIARGKDGHFVAKRLKKPLTPAQIKQLHVLAKRYEGKDYDLTFEWSDERMYCSELVWKMYQGATGLKLGGLETLGDFNLTSGAVKVKLKERYGNKVPLKQQVISPVAMFDSSLLMDVTK